MSDTSLNSSEAINQLISGSNRAFDLSNIFGGEAQDLLGPISKYLKDVTGGDRQGLLQATMPERRRVIDQYATAKKAIAEFAPRSGGQASSMNALQAKEAGDLATTTSGARKEGIDTAVNFGSNLNQMGLSAEALAHGDLQSIIQALTQKDSDNGAKWAQYGQAAAQIAMYAMLL